MHNKVGKKLWIAPGHSMMQDEEEKDSDLEGDKKIVSQKIPEIQDVFRYKSLQLSTL